MYDNVITHSYTFTHTHLDMRPGSTRNTGFLFSTRPSAPEKSLLVRVSKAPVSIFFEQFVFYDVKQAFREAADAPSDHSHRSWEGGYSGNGGGLGGGCCVGLSRHGMEHVQGADAGWLSIAHN